MMSRGIRTCKRVASCRAAEPAGSLADAACICLANSSDSRWLAPSSQCFRFRLVCKEFTAGRCSDSSEVSLWIHMAPSMWSCGILGACKFPGGPAEQCQMSRFVIRASPSNALGNYMSEAPVAVPQPARQMPGGGGPVAHAVPRRPRCRLHCLQTPACRQNRRRPETGRLRTLNLGGKRERVICCNNVLACVKKEALHSRMCGVTRNAHEELTWVMALLLLTFGAALPRPFCLRRLALTRSL